MGGLAGKVYNSSVGQIIKNSAAFRTYQRCSAISFLRTHNVSYSSSKKAVSRDMADMKICRNISFSEYFQFHFEEKDCHARDAYISNADRKRQTQGLNSNPALLNNKYKTYLEFSDFFYRDVCIYESESETDNVRDFLSAHNEFIAKPIGACKGQGVRKLCVTDSVDQALEELRSQYVGGVLLEEVIRQDEVLAQFHPLSVNTLRIATFVTNSGIKCRFPVLRMGVGNAIVDNGGAGGIFAALDDSGTIIAVSDELGHIYAKHPDTGIRFEQFKIPLFLDACELCKQLAGRIPENRYCSWDLALSMDRWILVEGNASGHILWQIASGIGIKEELKELCAQCLQ